MSSVFVSPDVLGPEWSALGGGPAVGTGVVSGVETTLLSYTATAPLRVVGVLVSGTDYAKFRIVLNTSTYWVMRTGPERNQGVSLNLQLAIGDVFEVKVCHFYTGVAADFEVLALGV